MSPGISRTRSAIHAGDSTTGRPNALEPWTALSHRSSEIAGWRLACAERAAAKSSIKRDAERRTASTPRGRGREVKKKHVLIALARQAPF
jgi:ribosome modulation factor